MAADMQATFRSIVESAGGTVVGGTRRNPLPKSEAEQQTPRILRRRRNHP